MGVPRVPVDGWICAWVAGCLKRGNRQCFRLLISAATLAAHLPCVLCDEISMEHLA